MNYSLPTHYIKKFLKDLESLEEGQLIVFDREFSYEDLLEVMSELRLRFVIRLNTGNRVSITDTNGEKIVLGIARGEKKIWRDVYYKGNIKVNLVAYRRSDLEDPLYVMTNIEPEEALKIYLQRMKIDESFRDNKNLLGMEKVMNKKEENTEKMIGIALIGYAIGLLIGEELRDRMYTGKGKLKYSGFRYTI